MQQHTVPRDIGSQEFKLVGSMTLRQFGFLASGFILAYALFLLPIYPIIKWPPLVMSILLGFAAAFMPIQERSLDQWFVAFIKAIIAPSQRVWRQAGLVPEFFTLKLQKSQAPLRPHQVQDRSFLTTYLKSLPVSPEGPLDLQESAYLNYLHQSFVKTSLGKTTMAPTDTSLTALARLRSPIELGRHTLASTVNFANETIIKLPSPTHGLTVIPGLKNQRVRKLHFPGWVSRENPQIVSTPPPSTQPVTFFVPSISLQPQGQVMAAKPAKTPPVSPPPQPSLAVAPTKTNVIQTSPRLSSLEPAKPWGSRGRDIDASQFVALIKPAAFPTKGTTQIINADQMTTPPLTTLPNALNGVVQGSNEELLSGVIIVMKDEQGTPVRALKTNRLGQFVIATPLPNGTYIIELEKDGFVFDIIKSTITGTVLPPIKIIGRKA